MPRVNLGRNLRDEAIVRLVWGSAEVERIDRKQLASYAGVSLRTIHERRKKPGMFTLDEYLNACRKLHIPIEEARAALRY